MLVNRRRAIARIAVSASGASVIGVSAFAATWPSRPTTVVVPVSAGGAADALARSWAEYMTRALGNPVIVENKPGANGTVAATYVAKQPADGYTLLFGSTSNMSLNRFSYKSLPYDAKKDFDPVLMLATSSQVFVANPASGIRTLDDLVRLARASPGRISYGSAGKGNTTHLNVEYVAQHFGLQLTHVPYKGAAPAMIGVVAGETQFMCDAIVTASVQAQAGKVVPFLVIGAKRSPAFPSTPTILEAGMKDYPVGGWYGVMAPKGVARQIVDRLNSETVKFWNDPQVKGRMQALYMDRTDEMGPEAVARMMEREAAVWGPLIAKLGIQND
jgi:tripartite-type tricarboxylate transporter receptor subunit TctC